jgi:hypothetical protein
MHRPSSTPRSNCSPAWPAPPCRCLLCSRCHPKLLHTLAVMSPRLRSGQANTSPPLRPGRPPHPGPTSARRGRLLHVVTSSTTDASPSSSTPRSGQADAPPLLRLGHPPRPGLCHLGLWHALAPPRRRLTTGHHHRRLRSACRPPNSSRWLCTSSARPPPLDATSRLGPPPPDAIGWPPRALVR